MSLSMLSCDIDTPRPNTGTITIVLEEIPNQIKAVSIWCNANNWKASEVNGSSVYIKPKDDNNKATFILEGYVLSEPLQFQLTPMPAEDTALGDDWWSYAISGNEAYGEDKNNIVCNSLSDGTKITINSTYYAGWKGKDKFPCYGLNSNRWYDNNHKNCYLKE